MIEKIIIKDNTDEKQILLASEFDLTSLPDPHIVPLFGPNGIGKSTLLGALINLADAKTTSPIEVKTAKDQFVILGYQNATDNSRRREPKTYAESFDPRYLLERENAHLISEGQSVLYSVLDLFEIIGTGKNKITYDGNDIVCIIDEVDSGLSIDNLDKILKKLVNTAAKRKDVQVIFSFNNPYVLRYFPDVLSMYTGKAIRLETTDEMIKEINTHKDIFRKKRYYPNGKPKIPI